MYMSACIYIVHTSVHYIVGIQLTTYLLPHGIDPGQLQSVVQRSDLLLELAHHDGAGGLEGRLLSDKLLLQEHL